MPDTITVKQWVTVRNSAQWDTTLHLFWAFSYHGSEKRWYDFPGRLTCMTQALGQFPPKKIIPQP